MLLLTTLFGKQDDKLHFAIGNDTFVQFHLSQCEPWELLLITQIRFKKYQRLNRNTQTHSDYAKDVLSVIYFILVRYS